jgi:hypothetical protein
MKQKINIQTSPGLFPILGLIFIVLKLTGVITWSWWWVLAPIYIPLAICLIIVLIIIVTVLINSK